MSSAARPTAMLRASERRDQIASWQAAAPACVVALALALAVMPAFAAMYKWTDANGRVVYSDLPPPGNVKVESINAPPPPANPNAAKELAAKEAEMQQKKMLRAEADTKAAKAKADTDKKREQCAQVRGRIAMMQTDTSLLYRSNEKGQPVYMDDAARRREREQLEVWVRDNCNT